MKLSEEYSFYTLKTSSTVLSFHFYTKNKKILPFNSIFYEEEGRKFYRIQLKTYPFPCVKPKKKKSNTTRCISISKKGVKKRFVLDGQNICNTVHKIYFRLRRKKKTTNKRAFYPWVLFGIKSTGMF